ASSPAQCASFASLTFLAVRFQVRHGEPSPIMTEPGMEPPEGMVSNFDNPDREMYYTCIVSNVIGLVVCTLFIVLRLWARYRLSMRLRPDDSTLNLSICISDILILK